ncbi:GNAT family N-acetyltransferase [Thioalkalivibrio denitrificans]|uniref:GNAT family N-acetyltransferase n=1 Tax=Thioalkalivibrio denitrificans TaxID=108003 RepID=A0A1V3N8M6_9GAMM|nr:GNAT family N-acetyltransferase [Thioalkalivibrio denitrificans]OOG21449.1 GNAT family N-acetyltransferase [Thioalkalivibrio denitrificans]
MTQPLSVKRFTGSGVDAWIPELARLRIEVFRAFPYLYDGDPDYEERYLRTYTQSADSVIVLVFDAERIVGASTGLPLADETDNVIAPFRERHMDIQRIFYFGESVLLPGYRGRGLGVRFFDEREDHARALGRFDYTCFCAVDRPRNHPRRPEGYRSLDDFWRKRGYAPVPELKAQFSWQDLDEDRETSKEMTFWMKRLAP